MIDRCMVMFVLVVAAAGCRADTRATAERPATPGSGDPAAPGEPAAPRAPGVPGARGVVRAAEVTAVSILSRGGGNGEADRASPELGCWRLPGADGYISQPLLRFTGFEVPAGAQITRATLRLVFASWEDGFTVRGRYLAAAWEPSSNQLGWLRRDDDHGWAEAGARAEGKDLLTGPAFALTAWQGTGTDVQTVELDLAVVQGWIDDPRRNHGLTLINETEGKVTRLFSDRHATHAPSLELEYVVPGGPATPTGPTGPTAPEGGPDAAPAVAARGGLDRRVANPTCKAPPRPRAAEVAPPPPPPVAATPKGKSGLALQPLFPALATGAGKPFSNVSPIVARRVQMPDKAWLWFVGLRNGRVFQVDDPKAARPPATNLIDPHVPDGRDLSGGEDGFLGLAFDPSMATNPRRAHVYYVRGGWGSVALFRADVRKKGGTWVASGEVKLLSAGGGSHHYAGDVQFGPDGFLYLSVGDDEIGARTRRPANLRGKILRLDVHAAKPLAGARYGIPADNPYRLDAAGKPNPPCAEEGSGRPDARHACPEVYARGFRNPFRISFDRQGGQLWVGDTGARSEEINLVVRDGDHGWDTQEGTRAGAGMTAAVAELPAQTKSTCAGTAIIGGFVYRGAAAPGLVGKYLSADNGDGTIYALDDPYGKGRALRAALATPCARFAPASFTEDEHGELYVVSLNPAAGQGVFKLVAGSGGGAPAPVATPAPAVGPAETLSGTGCVDPRAPAQPVAAAIPYEVNAELWSDGLTKRRWMVLPDATTITVGGDGDLDFPVGTVLIKEFSAGSRRIETRLMVHHDDGDWAGYTYVWNPAQTDAVLADAAQVVDLGDGGAPWTVPGREDCLGCHTPARGRVLGLEVRQLDRTIAYPTGRRANQLTTLAAIGLLASAPPAQTPFPDPGDAGADPTARARAYLHANCASCHPGPGSALDLRFDTPLEAMRVCNARPATPVPGGTRVVAPGDAAHSTLTLRMKTTDPRLRMPRIGTGRVDRAGAAVIDAWIAGLKGCPAP